MTSADVYRALWRRKFLILVLTGIFVGAAWYFTSQQRPIYESSALIRIQQSGSNPDSPRDSIEAAQQLTQTYAKIIEAGALTDRILRRLPPAPAGVQARGAQPAEVLMAEPVESLDLLTIRARSPNARRSTAIANAAPRALQDFIRDTRTTRERIVPIASAELPDSPASPNYLLNIGAALLLAVILNCGIALLIEILSDRLPDSEELEESTGVPILAMVPPLDFAKPTTSRRRSGRKRTEVGALPSTNGSPSSSNRGAYGAFISRLGRRG